MSAYFASQTDYLISQAVAKERARISESLESLRTGVEQRRETSHSLEVINDGIRDPAFAQCQAFSIVLRLIDDHARIVNGQPKPAPTMPPQDMQ